MWNVRLLHYLVMHQTRSSLGGNWHDRIRASWWGSGRTSDGRNVMCSWLQRTYGVVAMLVFCACEGTTEPPDPASTASQGSDLAQAAAPLDLDSCRLFSEIPNYDGMVDLTVPGKQRVRLSDPLWVPPAAEAHCNRPNVRLADDHPLFSVEPSGWKDNLWYLYYNNEGGPPGPIDDLPRVLTVELTSWEFTPWGWFHIPVDTKTINMKSGPVGCPWAWDCYMIDDIMFCPLECSTF